MEKEIKALQEIKDGNPDLFDAMSKVIINARESLAVIKVNTALTTDDQDSSLGSHPHP